MSAAEKLWPKFFVVGHYTTRATAPCVLREFRRLELAVKGAEEFISESHRRHHSRASMYGVYVSACPSQWGKIGVQWESAFGPPLYSDAERLGVTTSNFMWTHVADRRGFKEIECYSRQPPGLPLKPPTRVPCTLMRLLHVQWRDDDISTALWSLAVRPLASGPAKSKRLGLAHETVEELNAMCEEQNAFNLSFRHGV